MDIKFKDGQHKEFFYEKMQQVRVNDGNHQSLIYLLGLSETTRTHFQRIYNIETGLIQPNCVYEAWITSSTSRLINLAFNLYTDFTPIPDDIRDNESKELEYIRNYTPINLFDNYEFFSYFVEAMKIRFSYECF